MPAGIAYPQLTGNGAIMTEIEPWARQEIEKRLARIREDEDIRFLIAVESGSRAWGFPSPDSDYDVRFIYLRPWQHYLTLRPTRDVIERQIVDDFDVNGWDIRKALGLLLNHNAVVAEWLESPIRYLPDEGIAGRLRDVADRFFNPRGYALHYASLGQNNVDRWDAGRRDNPGEAIFLRASPSAVRAGPPSEPRCSTANAAPSFDGFNSPSRWRLGGNRPPR